VIRPATPEDVPGIQAMIRELADHEDAADSVVTGERDLHAVLFGAGASAGAAAQTPAASAFVLVEDQSGRLLGYTIWCPVYCTWRGRVAQIDDVYIRAEAADQGADKALLREVARSAAAQGIGFLQWWGLASDRNQAASYRGLGADYDPNLVMFQLPAEHVADLAAEVGDTR
jgi:GNAT superfamily N-acetyltransferase